MTGSAARGRSLYVYAITERGNDPPAESAGLAGAPLVVVAHRDLAAVVSAHDGVEIERTEAALWQHEAVCEALLERGAVLPAKFGLVFSGEGKLRAELAARYEEFAAALRRVRGRVELGVRVQRRRMRENERPMAPSAEAGKAYLTVRLAERREAEALADAVHVALAELAVDSRRDVIMSPPLLLTAAYLVDRDQVGAFVQTVERLEQEHAGAQVVCTGPWPPYNFVTGASDSD